MGTFREIEDLFSEADTGRTAHLLLHREVPPAEVVFKVVDSPFGKLVLGQTNDGLCWSAFADDESRGMEELVQAFPGTAITNSGGMWIRRAERIISDPLFSRDSLCLLVKGSQFRLGVWRQLLDTPFGSLTSYGRIAGRLGDVGASRAVGAAVGANTIAFFIPCHRVVNADGTSGHFRWGAERKKAMIAWEKKVMSGPSPGGAAGR